MRAVHPYWLPIVLGDLFILKLSAKLLRYDSCSGGGINGGQTLDASYWRCCGWIFGRLSRHRGFAFIIAAAVLYFFSRAYCYAGKALVGRSCY